MDSRELKINRKNTLAFIRENPVTMSASRGGGKESDGAGGYTVTPGGNPIPVVGRLIPAGGRTSTRNLDGEEVQPAFVFIAAWDTDIRLSDVLVLDGRNYEVAFVRESSQESSYETWVELVFRG